MNNSRVSNSFVGFKPDSAVRLRSTINNQYDLIAGKMMDSFRCIEWLSAGGIGAENQGGLLVTHESIGWYSDEATEFFSKTLNPAAVSAMNKIYDEFYSLYNDVESAYKKWSIATGGNYLPMISWFSVHGHSSTLFEPRPNNNNGVKGVDKNLYSKIQEASIHNKNELDEIFNQTIRAISVEAGFLGANQIESMRLRLTTLKKYTMNELDKVIAIALAKIKETSEKYNATATQVANSFNN